MSSRVIQRKIRKILKDLLKKKEIQSILEDCDESSNLKKLLSDSESYEKYGDDALSFKIELESYLEDYSETHKQKREDVSVMLQYLEDLFAEIFPEIAATVVKEARKRGRLSTNSRPEILPRKKRNSVTATETAEEPVKSDLTTAQKNQLKQIVTKLIRDPLAEPFLFPVDKKLYPQYYEIIETPMDLNTVKEKISSYASLEEAFNDLRVIWENCRTFNEKGSDILLAAEALSDTLERLIVETFGVTETPKKKNGRWKAKPSSGDEDEPESTQKSGSKKGGPGRPPRKSTGSVTKYIEKEEEEAEDEEEDEDEEDADDVEEDEDEHIKSSKPSKQQNFVEDTTNSAVKIKRPRGRPSEKGKIPVSSSTTPINMVRLPLIVRNMKKVLKSVQRHELSGPFQRPIKISEAPGYFEIVKEPMDLSKIRTRILDYEDTPEKLLDDLKLVFENCMLYNQEQSDIYKNAMMLKEFAEVKYREVFPDMKSRNSELKLKIPRKIQRHKVMEDNYAEFSNELNYSDDMENRMLETKQEDDSANDPTIAMTTDSTSSAMNFFDGIAPPVETSSSSTKKPSVVMITSLPVEKETTPYVSKLGLNSVAQCEEMIKVLQTASNENSTIVREKSFDIAQDLIRGTKVPYVLVPNLLEVREFGTIPYPFHTERFIYPVGYCCFRKMKICDKLLIRTDSENKEESVAADPDHSYYFVDVLSEILLSTDKDNSSEGVVEKQPTFRVSLVNGVILSESKISPSSAWEGLIGNEAGVLSLLAAKLERCRSVFNRLCVSPDVVPFLEQVPMEGSIGKEYYKQIKSPMWFREIYNRLKDGTYDNEYDFAWDVRLVFQNCMRFNLPSSHLYKAAVRLSVVFEQLFAHWVHNVQDRSLTDRAKGAWLEWKTIRYYDDPFAGKTIPHPIIDQYGGVNEANALRKHYCSRTGEVASEADLYRCKSCEDEFLPSSLPDYNFSKSSAWVCPRCKDAMELCNDDLTSEPYPNGLSRVLDYSPEQMGGNFFVPATDLPTGWCQARRKNRIALKNWFLSPLGYEVPKEDVEAQIAYEVTVDAELMKAREKEFSESFSTKSNNNASRKNKSSRQRNNSERKLRSTRNASNVENNIENEEMEIQNEVTSNNSNAMMVNQEESGMPTGKLLQLVNDPTNHLLAWFSFEACLEVEPIQDFSFIKWSEVSSSNLPESGFFGLEIPQVKKRIEGLNGALTCKDYQFENAKDAAVTLLSDIEMEKKKIEASTAGEEKLKKRLAEERWYWMKARMNPFKQHPLLSAGNTSSAPVVSKRREDFCFLFPPHYNPFISDRLLAVWDFIDSAKYYIGTYAFAFSDLLRALDPPKSLMPTYGSAVFDDLGCLFVGILIQELRTRGDPVPTDKEFQEILQMKPLNVLTWPHLCMECIRWHSSPLTPKESLAIMQCNFSEGNIAMKYDILLLILNHPLIDCFIVYQTIQDHNTEDEKKVMEVLNQFVSVQLAIRENLCKGFNSNMEGTNSIVPDQVSNEMDVEGTDNLQFNWLTKKDLIDIQNIRPDLLWTESFGNFCDRLIINFLSICDNPMVNDPHVSSLASSILYWMLKHLQTRKLLDTELQRFLLQKFTAPPILDVERINKTIGKYQRAWGPQNLRNVDLFSEQYLTAFDFDRPTHYRNIYEMKCTSHRMLDRTLELMKIEIDLWNIEDRVSVLYTMIDLCATTKKFRAFARTRSTKVLSRIQDTSEPANPNYSDSLLGKFEYVNSPTRVKLQSEWKCSITGVDLTSARENSKWVAVNPEYLQVPNAYPSSSVGDSTDFLLKNDTSFNSDTADTTNHVRPTRHKPTIIQPAIALESALVRVAAVRAVAQMKNIKYEKPFGPLTRDPEHERPCYNRSMPLGFDCHGNSYWILGAQESMTLFPYSASGIPAKSNSPIPPLEPCVLMRTLDGWWGYYNGKELGTLLNSFSIKIPCEKLLKSVLTERLFFTSKVIRTGLLKIKLLQQEWIERRNRAEKWVNEVKISNVIPNAVHASRLLEVVWGRAYEVRSFLYYAALFKDADDPAIKNSQRAERDFIFKRQQRVKEMIQGDVFDFHPQKGWLRLDAIARVLELSASTTASRIHADPAMVPVILANLKKSSLHKRQGVTVGGIKQTGFRDYAESIQPVKETAMVSTQSSQDGEKGVVQEATVNDKSSGDNATTVTESSKATEPKEIEVKPDDKSNAGVIEAKPIASNTDNAVEAGKDSGVAMEIEGKSNEVLDSNNEKQPSDTVAAAREEGGKDTEDTIKPDPQLNASTQDKTSEESSIEQDESHLNGQVEDKFKQFNPDNEEPDYSFGYRSPITISSVLVSARMLRLKAELLNLFYALPHSQLQWPVDTVVSPSIEPITSVPMEVNESEFKNGQTSEPDGAVAMTSSVNSSDSVTVKDQKKYGPDSFLKAVQDCSTAKLLLDQVFLLEKSIPSHLFYQVRYQMLPKSVNCLASVALWIFALDRSICYTEIKDLQLAGNKCQYQLRTVFTPYCAVMPSCSKSLGHSNSCVSSIDVPSRIPDIVDDNMAGVSGNQLMYYQPQEKMVLMRTNFPDNPVEETAGQHTNSANRVVGMNQAGRGQNNTAQQKLKNQAEMEFERKIASEREKVMDIEQIQPYVPQPNEITDIQWV